MKYNAKIRINIQIFGIILTIIFIILKLTNVIDWNIFWILLPAILCIIHNILSLILLFIILHLKKK